MIRLTKLADYSIILLIHISRSAEGSLQTARDLSEETALPLPTVGRLLKKLSQEGFLQSHRGVHGGYNLSRPAGEISVAEIVRRVEGPIGMTACSCSPEPQECGKEADCPAMPHWQAISRAVTANLEQISLADMARPALPSQQPESLLQIPSSD